VKAVLALALFAVLGFAVAGCGSAKKIVAVRTVSTTEGPGVVHPIMNPITVVGLSATIPNVPPGRQIACKTLPGISVTAPATRTSVIARSRGKELRLGRLANGSIRVSCPSKKARVLG
jgi:hypothetical protein